MTRYARSISKRRSDSLVFGAVVDDRGGVAAGRSAIECPGLTDGRRVHVSQLGHVPADVVAMRVESLALARWG